MVVVVMECSLAASTRVGFVLVLPLHRVVKATVKTHFPGWGVLAAWLCLNRSVGVLV